MILPRTGYILAILVLLISIEAIAGLERISSFPHTVTAEQSVDELWKGAVAFNLDSYSVTGVAGCCKGDTAKEARNIIMLDNQIIIFECTGEFATAVLDTVSRVCLETRALSACMTRMREEFRHHKQWQKHNISVAWVAFNSASSIKLYVDGFCTAALMPQRDWQPDLIHTLIETNAIQRFGGWCENVLLLNESIFSYTNFLNSRELNKINPVAQLKLLQAADLYEEFRGFLSYDNATDPKRTTGPSEIVEQDLTISRACRLYLYSKGVALHPYEIAYINLQNSPEESLKEISDTFLERKRISMSASHQAKDRCYPREGLAGFFGVKRLNFDAAQKRKSQAVRITEKRAPQAIKALSAGWLIPQQDLIGQACIIVDINVPASGV